MANVPKTAATKEETGVENTAFEQSERYGMLRCADREAFVRDPLLAAELVRLCAVKGCDAEWDTFAAAMDACEALAKLDARLLRGKVQAVLLSGRPQTLAPLYANGALAGAGLVPPAPCLHLLEKVPCGLLPRWWALLTLSRADKAAVCGAFGYAESLARDLEAMDELYRAGAPLDIKSLKKELRDMPPLDYGQVFGAFGALAPGWKPVQALWMQLRESGEAYTAAQLALPLSTLLSAGVPLKKAELVREKLLDAVIDCPRLNKYRTLLGLAEKMALLV